MVGGGAIRSGLGKHQRHLNDLEETSEGHAAERRTNYWENAVINYGEQVQTVQMPVNLGQPQLRPVRARITHVNWLWGWESQSLDSRGRRVEAEGESVSHAAHELLRDQRRSRRRRAARTLGHIE